MYNIINEDALVLKKRYLQICDGSPVTLQSNHPPFPLIAALLLNEFENDAHTERELATLERRDEKKLLFYTYEMLATRLYNLFSVGDVAGSVLLLHLKGFIVLHRYDNQPQSEFYVQVNERSIEAAMQANKESHRQINQTKQQDHLDASDHLPKLRKAKLEHKYKREASRIAFQNKRAINLGLPGTLTLEEWIKTLEHFNWKCAYCQGKYVLLEHFIPLEFGSGTTWENCVPSCASCNALKSSHHPEILSADTTALPSLQSIREYLESRRTTNAENVEAEHE